MFLNNFFIDFSPFQKKKVTFSNIVHCVLIPCCQELSIIKDDLWWSSCDCEIFYHSSVDEIKKFIIYKQPMLTFKQAKNILYQPRIYDFEDSYYN